MYILKKRRAAGPPLPQGARGPPPGLRDLGRAHVRQDGDGLRGHVCAAAGATRAQEIRGGRNPLTPLIITLNQMIIAVGVVDAVV